MSSRWNYTPAPSMINPELLALSYAWGDASITETVFVNRLPIQTTTNLVEALKVLSRKPDMRSPLWIDAICINQASVAEKNSQVPLMSRIYGSAELVIVWLGLEENDSSVAMEFIDRMAQDPTNALEGPLSLEFLKADEYKAMANRLHPARDLLQSIEDLMVGRSYWRRRWTFQELVLSKRCTLVCGHSTVLFSRCKFVLKWHQEFKDQMSRLTRSNLGFMLILKRSLHPALVSFVDSVMTTTSRILGPLQGVAYYAQFVDGTVSGEAIGGAEYLPLAALYTTQTRQATDPKDCLYAVADIADLGFVVDYSLSTRQVYERFAAAQVKSIGDLSYLLQYSGVGRSNSANVISSWVPDWDWHSKSGQQVQLRNMTAPATLAEYSYDANRGLMSLGGSLVERTGKGLKLIAFGVTQGTIQEVCPGAGGWATTTRAKTNSQGLGFILCKLFAQDAVSPRSHTSPNPPDKSILLRTILISQLEPELWEGRNPLDVFSALRRFCSIFILLLDDLLNPEAAGYRYLEQLAINTAPILFDKKPRGWKELVAAASEDLGLEPPELALIRDLLVETCCFAWHGLMPFTTSSGRLGATRPNVLPGDLVCVISASAIPVVLRKVGDDYAFVSLCFIPEIMHGEVKATDEDGNDVTQEFGIF